MKNVLVYVLIAALGGAAVWIFMKGGDNEEVSAMKVALAKVEADNRVWRAEADARQAENEAQNKILEARNEMLSASLAARDRQISTLQSQLALRLADVQRMPPSDLALRWAHLITVPASDVLTTPDGYKVSEQAGRSTVSHLEQGASAIEENALLRQDKIELSEQVKNLTLQRDNLGESLTTEKQRVVRTVQEWEARQGVSDAQLKAEKAKTRKWKIIALAVTAGAAYFLLGR